MSDYSAKTIKELKTLAKDKGVSNWSTLNKADLVIELEKLDAKGDPSSFADMPDEVVPAPDGDEATNVELVKEEKPVPEPEPAPAPGEETKRPAPEVEAFKLMNGVRFVKPDGTTAILKAGRILKANEYDLDRVKASGGVLVPLVK